MNLGTIQCVHFSPLPRAVFVKFLPPEYGPEAHLSDANLKTLAETKHAVLEITTTSGDKLILDGTPDQYGWHDGGWIIPKKAVEDKLMLGTIEWSEYSDAHREAMEKSLQATWFEDLKVLYAAAQDLLKELDWETLMELEEEEMAKEVAKLAKKKFTSASS